MYRREEKEREVKQPVKFGPATWRNPGYAIGYLLVCVPPLGQAALCF